MCWTHNMILLYARVLYDFIMFDGSLKWFHIVTKCLTNNEHCLLFSQMNLGPKLSP